MARNPYTGLALKELSEIDAATLTELAESISETELDYLDGVVAGTLTASKALVVGSSGEIDTLTFATAHSGLLHGSGASGATHALGATADNAMEYYLTGTHTTGDMRGLYLRLYFDGAGGSGEAARIFSTVNNVSVATGGTVNGAHISLSMTGASAAVSGAANALRATFSTASTTTTPGGTLSVIEVDADIATETTLPATHAFIAFRNIGTGAMTRLMEVPNVASGGMLAAHVTDAISHSIRIRSADGTLYYIMCTTTVTNRTGGG